MTPLEAIRGIRRGHRQPLSKGRNFEAPPAGESDRSAGPVWPPTTLKSPRHCSLMDSTDHDSR